jgi:hypothetical protein
MSISNLKNHRYWEVINLIPQNTTFISKEMIKQLEIEQELIQKKFEIYNGLICQSRILFKELLHNIIKKWKKFKKDSIYNKIISLLIFNRWII